MLSSKAAASSKMAVQLKMRWSVGSVEANEPSKLVDCRGPRAKYQVSLSVSPSMWHAAHEPHASPPSDQRPRPVLKKRLPRSCRSCSLPASGSALAWAIR